MSSTIVAHKCSKFFQPHFMQIGSRSFSTAVNQNLRPLIVGGGLSGLTLALSLAKRGIRPTVIDHQRSLTEHFPTGLFLSSNAMQGFETLGLADEIVRNGKQISYFNLTHSDGKMRYGRINYGRLSKRLPVGITYSKLIQILHNALGHYGVTVHNGLSVSSIAEQPGATGMLVRFTAGRRVPAQFDVVIGADGTHSSIRKMMFPAEQFRLNEQQGHYEIFECLVPQPALTDIDSCVEMWGEGSRIYIVPVGGDSLAVTGTQYAMYGTAYHRDGVREFRDFRNRFAGRFSGLLVPRIIAGLEERGQNVWMRMPLQVRMRTWVNGRVALIGNAAHAMHDPHRQETAMCVEDALVLGHQMASQASIDNALESYVLQRFQRVYHVQKDAAEQAAASRASSAFRLAWRMIKSRFTHHSWIISPQEKKVIKAAPPQVLVKVDSQ